MNTVRPTLRKVQERLAAEILGPSRSPDWLEPRSEIATRLAVYAQSYPARIADALLEAYPAVFHLAGASQLRALVPDYARALSRHSYNLNDVGAELPDFLGSHPLARRFPFLPDLARLEWSLATAFHAHEGAPLDVEPLRTWTPEDWEDAMFRFQPSVAVVRSMWPIVTLWNARDTPLDEIDIALDGQTECALVYRHGFDVECETISSLEADCLSALLRGERLSGVMRELDAVAEPADVSAWFSRCMELGLVTECETPRA